MEERFPVSVGVCVCVCVCEWVCDSKVSHKTAVFL